MSLSKSILRDCIVKALPHYTNKVIGSLSIRLALDSLTKNQSTMFFNPMPTEPDIKELLENRLSTDGFVILPFLENDEIVAGKVTDLDSLTSYQPVDPNLLEIIVVPGRVFDRRRNRIGRGKGHYDQFLAKIPDKLKIGVAFQCQLIETVPIEAHDIKMDILITDKEMLS